MKTNLRAKEAVGATELTKIGNSGTDRLFG
jgi:hypothetical protein